jgi:hypothetical protein
MNIQCQNSAYVGRTHLNIEEQNYKVIQGEIDTINLNLGTLETNYDISSNELSVLGSNYNITSNNLDILSNNYNITSNYIEYNVKPLINIEITPGTILPPVPTLSHTYIYNSNILGEIRFWVRSARDFIIQYPLGVPEYRTKIDVDGKLKLYYTYDFLNNATWGNGWIDPAVLIVGLSAGAVNQGSAITALQGEIVAVDVILTNKIDALVVAINAILAENACLLNTPAQASDLEGLMTNISQAFSLPQGKNALKSAFENIVQFARTRQISFLSRAGDNISAFINNNSTIGFIVGAGGVAVGIAYGFIQNGVINNQINVAMAKAIEDNSNLTSNDRRDLYDFAINDVMSSNVISMCQNNFYLNQAQGFISSNILTPQTIQQMYGSKIGLGISPSNSVFPLDVVGSINGDYYYRAGVRQFMGTSNDYSNLTRLQGFINSNVLSTQTIPKIATTEVNLKLTTPTVATKIDINNGTITGTSDITQQFRVVSSTTDANTPNSAITFFGNTGLTNGIGIYENGISTYGSSYATPLTIKTKNNTDLIYFKTGSVSVLELYSYYADFRKQISVQNAITIQNYTTNEPFINFITNNNYFGGGSFYDYRIIVKNNNIVFTNQKNTTTEKDVFTISSNGDARIYGNVGIGTSASPAYNLNVNGTFNASQVLIAGTDILTTITNASNYLINYNNHTNKPWINSGTNIYSANTGNTGIGTATPSYKLDVIGISKGDSVYAKQLYINPNLVVGNSPDTAYCIDAVGEINSSSLRINGDGTEQTLRIYGLESSLKATIGVAKVNQQFSYSAKIDDLVLLATSNIHFQNGTGNANAAMSIKNNLVGIGTASPSEKLEIIGNTKIASNLIVSGSVGIGTASPSVKLDIWGGALKANGLTINGAENLNTILNTNSIGLTCGTGYNIYFNVGSGGEVMRVHNNNCVGIGVSSPVFKLDVGGKINANGLRLDGYSTTNTIEQAAGALGFNVAANNGINFSIDNVERFKISDAGNIFSSGFNNFQIELRDCAIGWRNYQVTPTSLFGDGCITPTQTGGTKYITMGQMMFRSPHVVSPTPGGDITMRFGRCGGISTGSYWDVGCYSTSAFVIRKDGNTPSIIVEPNTNIVLNAPTVYFNANIVLNESSSMSGGTNVKKHIWYGGAPITPYSFSGYYKIDIYPQNVLALGNANLRWFNISWCATAFTVNSYNYPIGSVDVMIDYGSSGGVNFKTIYIGNNNYIDFGYITSGYFQIMYNGSIGSSPINVYITPKNSY